MSYEMVQLGKVCSLINGRAFKPAEWANKGLPIIRIQNLNDETKEFNYFAGEYDKKHYIETGDLLFSWSGTPGTSFGAFFWHRGPAVLNQHIFNVKIDKSILFDQYFRYAINNQLDHIIDQAHGGVGLKHITKGKLEATPIPLPPLPTQKKIVEILDAAQRLIETRKAQIAEMDALVQSLFYDMFGDPVSNPMGWKKILVEDCCNTNNDVKCGPFGTQLQVHEFRKKGIPLWGIKHVNRNFEIPTVEFLEKEKAIQLDTYSIVYGDLVMTRKGTIGNCAVYPKHLPKGIMHSDVLRLRLNQTKALPMFMQCQFHFSRDLTRQLSMISQGAIMAGINVTKLKKLFVLLPPIDLQNTFADRVRKIEAQKAAMQSSLSELEDNFNALMQRAFKGELV